MEVIITNPVSRVTSLGERSSLSPPSLPPSLPPSPPLSLFLQLCGNYVLGAIYLLVFITVGAFVFANLVVAVVVTNLVRSWDKEKKGE